LRRSLDELIDDDPAMPQIAAWAAAAPRSVEILPAIDGGATLVTLQVTTHSTLGSLAFETGGVLIDDGWLRVLGGGSPRLGRSLASWNRRAEAEPRLAGALLVADDAIGGFFALNGDRFDGEVGSVHYFAPDTCTWQDLELGLTTWLQWAMCGDLDAFYDLSRWPDWRKEVAELDGDRALLIYPPLWVEGQAIGDRLRNPVAIEELWDIHTREHAAMLGHV
jgi:hypothetical protein